MNFVNGKGCGLGIAWNIVWGEKISNKNGSKLDNHGSGFCYNERDSPNNRARIESNGFNPNHIFCNFDNICY